MKKTSSPDSHVPLQVLLADDDEDDRFFFSRALKNVSLWTQLKMVIDGQDLMSYLLRNSKNLPDVLFLDINMPRKNGEECLVEIKNEKLLKDLPIVIYSTSTPSDDTDDLYHKGAHYYFTKGNPSEMKLMLHHVLALLLETDFTRPPLSKFVLSSKDLVQTTMRK